MEDGKDSGDRGSECQPGTLPSSSVRAVARLLSRDFGNGFIPSALRPCLSTVRRSLSKPQVWVVKRTTSSVGGRWTCTLSDALEPVWATTGWPFQALILLPVCCPEGAKEYFCYALLTSMEHW